MSRIPTWAVEGDTAADRLRPPWRCVGDTAQPAVWGGGGPWRPLLTAARADTGLSWSAHAPGGRAVSLRLRLTAGGGLGEPLVPAVSQRRAPPPYVLFHVQVAQLVEHLSIRRQGPLPEDVDGVLGEDKDTGAVSGSSPRSEQRWRAPHHRPPWASARSEPGTGPAGLSLHPEPRLGADAEKQALAPRGFGEGEEAARLLWVGRAASVRAPLGVTDEGP